MMEKKQGCPVFEAPPLFLATISKVFERVWSMEGEGGGVRGGGGGKPVEEEFVGVADLSCDLAVHVLCKAVILSYAVLCYALLCLSYKECICYILGLDCTP